MTVKLAAALVMTCFLAGCRDPGPAGDHGPRTAHREAAIPAAEPVSAPVPLGSSQVVAPLERPLPGGIQAPSFPHHVRLDRDTGRIRDGHPVREVGLELLGPNPREAEAEFSALVKQHGGGLLDRQERGQSLRLVYSLADGTSMLAWFRVGAPPGERYAIQQTDASGTLYLAWPYVEKGL